MKYVYGLVLWVYSLSSCAQESKDSTKSTVFYRNAIEIGGRQELFAGNFSDRRYLYVQYRRRFSERTDVFLKILHYSFGKRQAYQFEGDVYWKFRKGYTYVGMTYSDSLILPHYRIRAEVFKNIGRVEVSLGGGVIKPSFYKEIPFITGTLGYYFSNYFVYFRPAYSFIDGVSQSYFIQLRRYFDKDSFLAISALKGQDTGTSRNFNAIENSFGNDTYLIRLHSRVKVKRFSVGAGVDYGGLYIPTKNEYAHFTGMDIFINREF